MSDEVKKDVAESFLELGTEVKIGNDVIPVVASLDDLPRRKKREILALMMGVAADPRGFIVGTFANAADLAVAYAASQGVFINLDDTSIPLADQEIIDRDAMLVGFKLATHFNRAEAVKSGKGKVNVSPSRSSKSSKKK